MKGFVAYLKAILEEVACKFEAFRCWHNDNDCASDGVRDNDNGNDSDCDTDSVNIVKLWRQW